MSILIAETLMSVLQTLNPQDLLPLNPIEFSVQLTLLLTFIIQLAQLLVSILGLGEIFNDYLFRKSFISSFTSASAFTIITSQIKSFLGINVPRYSGPLNFIKLWIYTLSHLNQIHWITFIVACLSVILIVGTKYVETMIRKFVRKKHLGPDATQEDLNAPVPTLFPEVLFTIVIITGISVGMNLNETRGVAIIGAIPKGFPSFVEPWSLSFHIAPDILKQALLMSAPNMLSMLLVSMVVLTSIINTFPSDSPLVTMPRPKSSISLHHLSNNPQNINSGQDDNTVIKKSIIKPNISQELFGVSIAGIIGSFFLCFVPTGSLSKSAILANQTNAKSPICNLISVIVVGIAVGFLTFLFEKIPMPALAAVIVVALAPVAAKVVFIRDLIKKARKNDFDTFMANLKKDHVPAVEESIQEEKELDLPVQEPKVTAPSADDVRVMPVAQDSSDHRVVALLKVEVEYASGQDTPQEQSSEVGFVRPSEKPVVIEDHIKAKKCLFYVETWGDVAVWILTFLSVLVIDVSSGIYVGLAWVLVLLGLEWLLTCIINNKCRMEVFLEHFKNQQERLWGSFS